MRHLLVATLMYLVCGPAGAAQVNVLIVADTLDGSIGVGIKANEARMNTLLDRLEVEAGLKIQRSYVHGSDFNCTAIAAAVDAIRPTRDDSVIVYYAGHGSRTPESTSRFPDFDCKRSDAERGEGLAAIIDALREKNPRFLLAIADTCNIVISEPAPGVSAGTIGAAARRKAGFQRLFAGYSGTLVLSGAVPNERSWYSNGASAGGFFTSHLLTRINQNVSDKGDAVTWEDIAREGVQPIFIPRSDPERLYQHPQFEAFGLQRLP